MNKTAYCLPTDIYFCGISHIPAIQHNLHKVHRCNHVSFCNRDVSSMLQLPILSVFSYSPLLILPIRSCAVSKRLSIKTILFLQ